MMEKVILYGAGDEGEKAIKFCQKYEEGMIYAFCDKNSEVIKEKCGVKVISFEEAKTVKLPFVIAVNETSDAAKEIVDILEKNKVEYYDNIRECLVKKYGYDRVVIEREHIEFYHEKCMDLWYEVAEEKWAHTFWGDNSKFIAMFNTLDLTSVLELACGWGRHVLHYVDRAEEVLLVDVLQRNIDKCRERFAGIEKVKYYKNNGYDFADLKENTYTAIFSYDAMVHFEMMDIYSYLKEMYRVLVPGGMALIHHSNDSSDYKNTFASCSNEHGRNYMDKTIFAYLAYRCGFEIREQQIIDWGGAKDLDCISLIRKPK